MQKAPQTFQEFLYVLCNNNSDGVLWWGTMTGDSLCHFFKLSHWAPQYCTFCWKVLRGPAQYSADLQYRYYPDPEKTYGSDQIRNRNPGS